MWNIKGKVHTKKRKFGRLSPPRWWTLSWSTKDFWSFTAKQCRSILLQRSRWENNNWKKTKKWLCTAHLSLNPRFQKPRVDKLINWIRRNLCWTSSGEDALAWLCMKGVKKKKKNIFQNHFGISGASGILDYAGQAKLSHFVFDFCFYLLESFGRMLQGFVNYKTSPDFQSAWEVMFLKSRMGPARCTVFFPKAHHRCIWIRNIRFFFFYTNIKINNGSGFGLSAVMTECCHAKLKHNILLQLAWGTALAQVMANLVTAQACHRAPTLQDGGSLSAGWFVPKTRPAKASQHRSYPTTTFLCSRSNVSRYLYITSVWWFFFFTGSCVFPKFHLSASEWECEGISYDITLTGMWKWAHTLIYSQRNTQRHSSLLSL